MRTEGADGRCWLPPALLDGPSLPRAEYLRALGLVLDRQRRMLAHDLGFHADGVVDGVPSPAARLAIACSCTASNCAFNCSMRSRSVRSMRDDVRLDYGLTVYGYGCQILLASRLSVTLRPAVVPVRRQEMSNRRTFMEQCAKGAVGVAVSGLVSSSRVMGANDRVRFGLIGCGSRGKEIFQAAMRCSNAEAVAAADLYSRRLDEVKALAPSIKTYKDFRQLLDDKNVDAVLIATPQHQHALNFVPAIQAGKDVYQEKTMAFSPDHAKRMRKALDGSGRVVQVGIQMISGPGHQDGA